MRRQLVQLAAVLMLATPLFSQSAGLPSEETVNGFMQQTFGYDSSVTWKIA